MILRLPKLRKPKHKESLVSNIAIIRELYEAFATDGLDRVLELCDPDCVVTQDPALPSRRALRASAVFRTSQETCEE